MEKMIERFLFISRWCLVPMYLGLVGAIIFLIYKFAVEFLAVAFGIIQLSERQVLLSVLSLVDITLVANLLLMVILSGYENFVSKIDVAVGRDRPEWLGNLNFSGLKLKLIGSIVAIAAIDLLRAFMNISEYTSQDLAWKVAIQFIFVISGVLFALTDRIAAQAKHLEHELALESRASRPSLRTPALKSHS